MLPSFAHAHIVRLLAAGALAFVAGGVCGGAGAATPAQAQKPPALLARPRAEAPGFTLALQAVFPERAFPGLREILREGLLHGPTILISEWNAAAAAQETREHGRARLLPSGGGWVNFGQNYEQYQDGGGAARSRSLAAFLYGVSFYQPVYAWDSLTNNYKVWEMRQAMSERNVGETRRLLAIDIRRRFFDIILKAGELDLARKNLARHERDFREMEQAIADGTRAAGEIDIPGRAIQVARPEIMRLENELAALRESLVRITGLPEQAIGEIPSEIPAAPDLRDAVYALSGGAAAPPSAHLQNLADNARIEKLNFEITKKRLWPTLGVTLAVSQESRTPNYTSEGQRFMFTTWGAYATVRWTLFDGLATQAAKRAALERMKAGEAGRSLAEKQEGAERRAEIARLLVQWEQLQNTEHDLARARGGMEIVEQDFKNGTASARQAEDARMAYLNALQNPHGGAHAARANFYIALVACLSNRGQDPVIMAMQPTITRK